jgi:hypothetical protein
MEVPFRAGMEGMMKLTRQWLLVAVSTCNTISLALTVESSFRQGITRWLPIEVGILAISQWLVVRGRGPLARGDAIRVNKGR